MTIKARAEADADVDQPAKRAFDFDKPFFNSETAAAFTDAPSIKAFWEWARKVGIKSGRKGRRLMYAKADLLKAMAFGHRKDLA